MDVLGRAQIVSLCIAQANYGRARATRERRPKARGESMSEPCPSPNMDGFRLFAHGTRIYCIPSGLRSRDCLFLVRWFGSYPEVSRTLRRGQALRQEQATGSYNGECDKCQILRIAVAVGFSAMEE